MIIAVCLFLLLCKLLFLVVHTGWSWGLYVVGKRVFICLDIISWAGLKPVAGVGVLWWSRSAISKLSPVSLHFPKNCLAVFTADSTFPFPLGWYGLEVQWSNSHLLEKVLKSWQANCGPLSLQPCQECHISRNGFSPS